MLSSRLASVSFPIFPVRSTWSCSSPRLVSPNYGVRRYLLLGLPIPPRRVRLCSSLQWSLVYGRSVSRDEVVSPRVRLPRALRVPDSLRSPSTYSSILLCSASISTLMPTRSSPTLFNFSQSTTFPSSIFPTTSFSPRLLRSI